MIKRTGGVRIDIDRGDAGPDPTPPGPVPEPDWYPPAVTAAIATSPDGQWFAVRQDTTLRLYSVDGDEAGVTTLATADADIAIVGPPITVIAVERPEGETSLVALAAPGLGETSRITVDGTHDLAATTGPRLALIGRSSHALAVLRTSGRAFMSQPCDPGGPVELAAGLDKNQLLLVLAKRLEIWDAVSGRPMLRPSFTLPPGPRSIGGCVGHVWCHQRGGSELVLYRLSDGRPFAHRLGSRILSVASHPATSYVVVQTEGGLLRIQAFAHTIDRIKAPPAQAYALAGATTAAMGPTGASSTDLRLIGAEATGAPWRQPLVGAAPAAAEPAPSTSDAMQRIRTARERAPAEPVSEPVGASPAWRDALVAFATELAGKDGDRTAVPGLPLGTTLAALCQRARIGTPARRALTVLYACYLAGDPGISIARLARLVGGDDGWREALGTGELGERLLVASRGGRVALVDPIARAIDGAAPRAIEFVGHGTGSVVAGGHVVDPARLGEPMAALTQALGRFALVGGALPTAVLEGFAHGLTAVAIAGPSTRLRAVKVPRGGGLLVVASPSALPPSMAMWPTLDTTG